MAFSLKRVVDYKLLYDSLADPSNGMIKLTTLTTRWPRDLAASNLPRGLPEQWRTATDDNGYLDWEKFSSALKKALEEDKPRLSRNESSRSAENPSAQRKQQFANRAPRVTAEEIETFLSSCRGDVLVQALGRTRKEVYKCQMSLHELESSAAAKDKLAGQKSDSSRANGHVKVPLVSSIGQEKEELLKGMAVMEITRLWFSSRLEQLALEEKLPAKKMKPEELLAALDRRDGQPVSESLRHIQEINSHLGQLAKEAPGLSLEQVKKQYHQKEQQLQQQQQKKTLETVVSDPGPRSQQNREQIKPLTQGQGGVPTRAAPKVQMNFPAYNPSRAHVNQPHVSPLRSSSMREMPTHTMRGETETVTNTVPRQVHRSVSMSTQNLTNQRQDGQSYHHQYHQQQGSYRPRRSQSFSEKSTSSGSLAFSSGYSSNSGNSTSDYPRTSSVHGYGYGTLNQYPLRGSSSLQTLPSSGSYGSSGPSDRSHTHESLGRQGHHMTHGQRSSSVRNIPLASYSGAHTAAATTSNSTGKPIISQPTSTVTARVESVDIPSQPAAGPTAMANMRDLSSSYPGHGRGSRTGGGGGGGGGGGHTHTHTHEGIMKGENPKPSRRHLHMAVQEQSLRIKQLEAENARERTYRGQQQMAAASSSGHPVIKTSALQSVV